MQKRPANFAVFQPFFYLDVIKIEVQIYTMEALKMGDLLLALVIGIGLIGFAVFYVLVFAFWYISIPLFCIYVYFKYFRKERKFEARVLEP